MSDKDSLLSIPKFDGDYEHWAMLMENLLRSKEWWDLIEVGLVHPETDAQRIEQAEAKLKDLKVKNYLFASINKTILKTIAKKETSKDIWESMKTKYQGNKRVQSAQLQRLRRMFEVLEMKEEDTITEYVSKVMVVANDMRNLGEDMADDKIVEKILRTLVEKFTYVVCAIEESKDIKEMTVDELQSSLLVHEQNLSKHTGEEHVLKVEAGRSGSSQGRGGYQYTRGRGGYRGGRGDRRSTSFDKSNVECFKCHKMGHFKNECPSWEKNANYAELEEDVLLMAQTEAVYEQVWYLDSGCSNHMCGTREWFVELDSEFRQQVKLGDDRRMQVEGRGSLRMEINGITQVITSVYYVPGLKNNLLSVGQLQQKGLRIVIEEDLCEIWHKQQRRLLMVSKMTRNRMFVVRATVMQTNETMKGNQMLSVIENEEDVWHMRFGHVSHSRLAMLTEKEMVTGLPKINKGSEVCEVCMKGKQIRESIPKASVWKASRGLELVHSDICGPISPTSASGRRYVINFIDDYSRKCWTFFLAEKSEAFRVFKEFKAAAERELGVELVCLRTDRGGEFNSKAFQEYCVEKGIKRQLTTAYTPQQNGVAERKNRSIMNMVRCMMFGMKVPLKFWPEAAQYAVHILNRCPSASLGDTTPSEKWSKHKPSVEHLRVFGCVAFALIPYERRIKLDEKSIKCVMFGVSKESKGYRLYDPVGERIIISKDVKFDEKKQWDWEEKVEDDQLVEVDEAEKDQDEGGRDEEPNETTEEEETTGPQEPINTEAEPRVPGEGSNTETIRSGRNKARPVWMKDYVCENRGMFVEFDNEDVMVLFTSEDDPSTFEEAVREERWRRAMEAEIGSIEGNHTWDLVELPEGAKVIGVKWVFKTKLNEKGEVDKFKARLVAKGFLQTHGVDFYEVFAPVAKWDTIRVLLGLAAQKGWSVYQLDVKSAFLQGELTEDVFVEQPKGFTREEEDEGKVYKLNKALYGLRQAPRAWYSRIEGYFVREGFRKCYCEHTLFVKEEGGSILVVSLYVDDLIYTSDSQPMLEAFKMSMKEEFAMTDLGKMKYFLGVEVIQDEVGIFINQKKYAIETLKKYGLEDCNSVRNPMVPGNKLTREGSGEAVDPTMYKQLVGSLRYLTATRPDLIYSVNIVSRYMENPRESHMLAVKRILRYVQGTLGYGIQYRRDGEEELVGFVDSDYAGDEDDRKSTSGYTFMIGGGAVSWSSKKQPIVTLSTTEAEYVSAANGATQAIWLRNVLEEIGFNQKSSTVLFCDNSSAIKLSKNPVLHGRSKHIHVRYHFLRELVNEGVIALEYCSTKEQLSDIMTKPVKLEVFERLRSNMGVGLKEE